MTNGHPKVRAERCVARHAIDHGVAGAAALLLAAACTVPSSGSPGPDTSQAGLERAGSDGAAPSSGETATLRSRVEEVLNADDLAVYEALAVEQGLDLDAPTKVVSWERVEDDARTAFGTSPGYLDALEKVFSGSTFEGGLVNESDLREYVPPRYEIRPEDLQRAQSVLDEHYPRVRAAARGAAEEIAEAKLDLWKKGNFRRSPRVALPPESPRGIGVVNSSTMVVGGWHVGYQVMAEDYPRIDELRDEAKAHRSAMLDALRAEFR